MLSILIALLAILGILLFAGALSLYSLFISAVAVGIVFSIAAYFAARREQDHHRV